MNMREVEMITIAGGSGFIGTRLGSRLESSGAKFTIVDKAKSVWFPEKVKLSDVRDFEAMMKAIPASSVIINLAAEHRDDVRPLSLYDEVNVDGARRVCEVAREKNIGTIIFTSSVAVYGFAPPHTDETGEINYFNDYGRTKWMAEGVYKQWQAEDPEHRTLVIVRPTVVFGERNRGNVFNLLKLIASGRFIMIGKGANKKSMAYVENVVAFLEYAIEGFNPGVHIYNYVDKPDYDMNKLVVEVKSALTKTGTAGIRIPYVLGFLGGKVFDFLSFITRKRFSISSVRVKKFTVTTQFNTSIEKTGFVPPVAIENGLKATLTYEFVEDHANDIVYYSE